MPWREVSIMDQRREFVRLAKQEEANRRELCRRFGIHPDTGYKWLARWVGGDRDLCDRSRRPHSSPTRSDATMEALVLKVRDAHPAWGARKIARCLEREGVKPPALSTVHEIMRRHGRVVAPAGSPRASQRFERPAPNLLWQMDFKGWVGLGNGMRCHPLTMVDDHSRYVPCLKACADEQGVTVQSHLETTFRHYGLPEALFVDNGGPWGDASQTRWTRLCVWLLKLGVAVLHSRPYHPQSRGKNERFHRTLKDEVFALRRFRDLAEVQRAFDQCARSITSSGHMRHSSRRYRPAAIGRAFAPCRTACQNWSTTGTTSSVPSPLPRPMSASRGGFGKCRKRFKANAWLSDRWRSTANTASTSAPIRSPAST